MIAIVIIYIPVVDSRQITRYTSLRVLLVRGRISYYHCEALDELQSHSTPHVMRMSFSPQAHRQSKRRTHFSRGANGEAGKASAQAGKPAVRLSDHYSRSSRRSSQRAGRSLSPSDRDRPQHQDRDRRGDDRFGERSPYSTWKALLFLEPSKLFPFVGPHVSR